MDTYTTEKNVAHPLEQVFGIEPGTTVVEQTHHIADTVPVLVSYDEKDQEIDDKLDDIYRSAMGTASDLSEQVEMVEGKYKARMGEVAASMLMVALGAAREKANIKQHKDKLKPNAPGAGYDSRGGNTTNNIIVADRNELLKSFMQHNNIIDVEKTND